MMKEFPETIYIVDGVCPAAEPEYVDDMGIHTVYRLGLAYLPGLQCCG